MTPPVHGQCDHCEKQGTLYHASANHEGSYLCQEHRADYALACASGDDLRLLLKQTCLAWLAQWGHLPGNLVTAGDELQCMAEEVMEEAISEFRSQQEPNAGKPTVPASN